MEKRRIGSLEVGVVGLGCNNFGKKLDAAATEQVIDAALDAGVDFLDTADIYGDTRSEEFIGQALRGRRSRVVLATKFGYALDEKRKGAHPDYLRVALEDSLRRLATDHVDLYQLHVPDPEVPIADTLGALNELVRAGKVREIGCSNFTAKMLGEAERARSAGAARFASVQNEYSLFHREPEGRDGALAACARLDVAFIPFFPLASGLLTGKYRRGQPRPEGARLATGPRAEKLVTDANLEKVDALDAYAKQRGHTLLELAISWLLARPEVVSVIAGATSPEQARANAAAGGWKLSAEELAGVDRILGAPAGA